MKNNIKNTPQQEFNQKLDALKNAIIKEIEPICTPIIDYITKLLK